MKYNHQLGLTLAGVVMILGGAGVAVIGCGRSNDDCRIVELAEAKVLRAWIDGGLKDQAEKKAPEWKAAMETMKLPQEGPFKISKAQRTLNLTRFMEAMAFTENAQSEGLMRRVAAMKRGVFVPEQGAMAALMALGARPDGKTPEQRIQEYQPRIEAETKAAEAHEKAAQACREAVAELKKLNG